MKKQNPTIEIIVIGDELLSGKTLDSNSHFITKEITRLGLHTNTVSIIGDNKEQIIKLIKEKTEKVDVLIITGGLGPTPDDITRFAVSKAIRERLVQFPALVRKIRKKLKNVPKQIARISEIEALLPETSVPLENTVGIAPGFRVSKNRCVLFCIPGVPAEAHAMFYNNIKPYLKKSFKKKNSMHYIIKTVGLREAEIYVMIKPYLHSAITIGMYPRGREVEIRLQTELKYRTIIQHRYKKINTLLKEYVYSNSDELLEETIGNLLRRKKLYLACAESCTGGLIAKRITDIPGSSRFFLGATVTYSNRLKEKLLNVKRHSIVQQGAVSASIVRQMVKGLVKCTGADIGISITGIAGPGGGTQKKRVGLVYIGVSYKGKIQAKRFQFKGNREKVRWLASQAAFETIWRIVR
ncbi:MAG: CinA family nicotinamide mononucleotide deamidase-related protein [Candidatus Omnitrophica bacterium]|nr:CinA family nicotinamide mononucleotide deamidase-related protein [Candidatus Omnitrophota bacterium]